MTIPNLPEDQARALELIVRYVQAAEEPAGAAWLARRLGCSRTWACALARALYRRGLLTTAEPPWRPSPEASGEVRN